MLRRKRAVNAALLLYFVAIGFGGIGGGCFGAAFNNFLDDIFHISAQERGFLELPRELPGFLVALFTGALAFLPETRVAAVAMLLTGAGMFGLATLGRPAASPGWTGLLAYILLWATGTHLIMPVQSAIGMSLASPARYGRRLGEVAAIGAAASIVGFVFVWVVSDKRVLPPYGLIFAVGAVMTLAAAMAYLGLREIGRQTARPRLVYRRCYRLYYLLSLLFGARKQLFITFGPWVLIKIYGQQVDTFARLGIINAVLTIFTNPGLGALIDRWGERRVLILEGLGLALICVGYGAAHLCGPWGLPLALTCFVLDQVAFGLGNARATYLAKIAERPEDVTASLSVGISLDHAVSMTLPTLGGLIWMRYGHAWVFVGGAFLALLYAACAASVRVPKLGPQASLRTEDIQSVEGIAPE